MAPRSHLTAISCLRSNRAVRGENANKNQENRGKSEKMSNPQKFDIKIVQDKFSAALRDQDDVDLELYLESFDELSKFFTLMGTVFGFVSKDLRQKVDHLAALLRDDATAHHYATVKTMIEHETESDLLHRQGFVSGSRTLLRIHRGLEFIRSFLAKIAELEMEEGTGPACRDAYDRTLAKHHSFVIRKGAHVAMYTLPARAQLLRKVCGDDDDVRRAVALLPDTLDACAAVYDRIERLYAAHDLHGLP